LRTPLTSILGWSHLLTGGKLDKQQTARAIETIARNARAQGRLIDELLDISRIMTGKLCLDLRAVKLAPLIQAVVNDVRPAADAKNINLKAAFDSDVGRILGDPDRLQQIVWNLLTAYAGIDDRKRALAAGYEMHIPKPFVAAELISAAIFLAERHSG
jgi:signal transduction histidine kinase